MPSFTLNSISTTAQTLTNGNTGTILENFGLVVTGSAAVSSSGDTDITVLGTLLSVGQNAINHASGFVFRSTVGERGFVGNSSTGLYDAITVNVSIRAEIFNAGLIKSSAAGIRFSASDSGADLIFQNAGTFQTFSYGVSLSSGTGAVRVVNSGEIFSSLVAIHKDIPHNGKLTVENTGDIFGPQYAIMNLSGQGVVRNTGTITGIVLLDGDNSSVSNIGGTIQGDIAMGGANALLTNTGEIDGNITFYNGNDTIRLLGGSVSGTIAGASGDDTYVLRTDANLVEEAFGGTDLVKSWISHTLGTHFENLTLLGGDDLTGAGNDQGNIINGNGGDNRLRGAGGIDYIYSGAGDDIAQGGLGGDYLDGEAGDDILRGGSHSDNIVGGPGDDFVFGGLGTDTLSGGPDNDTFFYLRRADSKASLRNADLITDFTSGEDLLDLTALIEGRFKLNIGGGFAAKGPSVRTKLVNLTDIRVEIDVDGDGKRDMLIRLNDTTKITADDFLL